MIDKLVLTDVLEGYKEFLPKHWGVEKYKWQAVRAFQEEWDAEAADFHAMLVKAIPAKVNLLATSNYYPGSMILQFAEVYPEEVRSMFADLFNEGNPLSERFDSFITESEKMMKRPEFMGMNSHYQDHRAMTTYLWLRYPGKYFLYQFNLCRATALALNSDFVPKKGKGTENAIRSQDLFGEIADALRGDPFFRAKLDELLDESCHDDPSFTTLVTDFTHYLWKYASKLDEWWPDLKKYDPGITAEQWVSLMDSEKVFKESSFVMLGCMLAVGGEATCSELAEKFGRTYGWYNSQGSSLAERVAFETDCDCVKGSDGMLKWWPILFQGKEASSDQPGSFVWRLRPELRSALEAVDWSDHELYEKEGNPPRRYWWMNASEKFWSWSSAAIGETIDYTSLNDNGNKRHKYKYFLQAKAGDMVIGYQTHPQKEVVCLCEVLGSLDEEGLLPIMKVAEASSSVKYDDIKDHPILKESEYVNSGHTGTMFALTEEEFDILSDMAGFHSKPEDPKIPVVPAYDKADFLDDVYLREADYDSLRALLKRKKNVILKGAPGTGKTYAARRLAWSMMGCKDDSRIEFVQFHQSSAYEDFVVGYRPDGHGGFEVRNGIFVELCLKAERNPSNDYYLIIDEINRANVSRVFGELLMLIEGDHRGERLSLSIDGSSLCVPENLYIVGMMNTADRSLALIDYALRRRFGFFTMRPAFESEGFLARQKEIGSEKYDMLVHAVASLNERISSDASLGEGFEIGHSYLCIEPDCDVDAAVKSIVEYDLVPLVEEYWFDDLTAAGEAADQLRGSIA